MRNAASFRDPSGAVFEAGGRIFRGVRQERKTEVLNFLRTDFYKKHAGTGIVPTREVSGDEVLAAGIEPGMVGAYALWLEHQALDFITYPYEWGFEFLKAAAILHLDLQLEALRAGYQMKDASSYNIQFIGCRPVFIDILSFEPYAEGAKWVGYKQFCEHFLAPLALGSYSGIDFNPWLRGSLDGLDIIAVSKALPLRSYLSPTLLGNIHAHAWAMSKIASRTQARQHAKLLPKKNLLLFLESLRRFTGRLKPRGETYWNQYDAGYMKDATRLKEDAVSRFVTGNQIRTLLDAGCNTGHFCEVAFKAGAKRVIGLDNDGGAINRAARNPFLAAKAFTPIRFDLANPSPSSGWNLAERLPLDKRLPAIDGVLCLALIHHLVIGKNIPLPGFLDWVLGIAPKGVIEFVPKEDPMVANLLAHREDIFPEYREDVFLGHLKVRAGIAEIINLPGSLRKLVFFERHKS